jgi:ribosomal protein S18 acetylase RimI-like enzyme
MQLTATEALPRATALYDRMTANVVASCVRYAEGATDAAVEHMPGVSAGVFPVSPERGVYNNALLDRGLSRRAAAEAIEAAEALYADRSVPEYAVWAHESDVHAIAQLERRGFVLDTSTRAMAMTLDDLAVARPQVEAAVDGFVEYLQFLTRSGAPEGLLAGVDAGVFHVALAELAGEIAAGAISFDHDGDCGIYNVGTLPHARRRGLGSAVTVLHMHEARERGCTTASLQATPMAERLYAALGFRDLGRFLEYVPGRVSPL